MVDLRWDGNDFNNSQDSSGATADQVSHNGELQQGYQHGSLTEGLVAYYSMEKGEGKLAHDGAFSNMGQIKGASWSSSGYIGTDSLDFDGIDDYILTEHSDGLAGMKQLTISVWIKPKSYPKSYDTTFRPIVVKGGGDGDWEYQLTRRSGSGSTGDDNQVYFGLDNDTTAIYDSLPISSWSSITGEWHHLVGRFDGVKQSLEVYWDGELALSKDASISSAPSRSGELRICWDGDTNNDRYNPAEIDDLRIYDRALSRPEIKALSSITKSSGVQIGETDVPGQNQGGVSRYKLNGDVQDSWSDNDGSTSGSPPFNTGVYGQAVDLDGSSQYVETVDSSSLDISGEVTVSVWAKIEGDLSNNHMAVSKRYDYDGNIPYEIQYGAGSGGRYKFNIHDGSQNTIAEAGIDDNDWHHILGTFDGGKVRIYRDGSLVEEISRSNSIPENNVPVYLGVRPPESTGNAGEYFNGKLDDVRIYNTALTSRQVETLYHKSAYRIPRKSTLQ